MKKWIFGVAAILFLVTFAAFAGCTGTTKTNDQPGNNSQSQTGNLTPAEAMESVVGSNNEFAFDRR